MKYTTEDVDSMIDFGYDGEVHNGVSSFEGHPRPCSVCDVTLNEIAESLSLDGTEVKGVFTEKEKSGLLAWVW